jgi:hypothetical protein
MTVPAISAIAIFMSLPATAALLTFDEVVAGETSFEFDGDGDSVNDVIFSTTDPLGFNTTGPGANQNFIHEPGLEGTSLLSPDLRVDFLVGATDSIRFGFALDSFQEDPGFFASFSVFDSSDNLLVSQTVAGAFGSFGGGQTSFPEGLVDVSFSGTASYATFNFTSELGRYIIDDFEGTFGTTERTPEPSTLVLLGLGLAAASRFGRRLGARKSSSG